MEKKLKELLIEGSKDNSFQEYFNLINLSIEKLIISLREFNYQYLEEVYDSMSNITSYVIDTKIIDKSIDFIIGRYVGCLEIISEVLLLNRKQENTIDFFENTPDIDIPHFKEIIAIIAKNPNINHQHLADKIGISKSTLTPVMDKLIKKGMVTYWRPGKYKFYNLTQLGNLYYNSKLNNSYFTKSEEELIEETLLFLKNAEDPSAFIGNLTVAIFNKEFKSKSFREKNSSKMGFININFTDINKSQKIFISVGNEVQNYPVTDMSALSQFQNGEISKQLIFNNNLEKVAHSEKKIMLPYHRVS